MFRPSRAALARAPYNSPYNCTKGPVVMPGQMLFNGVLFSIKWDRRARTDDLLRVNPIPIGYLNLLKSVESYLVSFESVAAR